MTLEVALLAGAWIETPACRCRRRRDRGSPSLRGRGSKHCRAAHSLRRRGRVALLAGAWIETIWWARAGGRGRRRPPCGGVDRNLLTLICARAGCIVALLAGAWIETGGAALFFRHAGSPSLRGRGSKREIQRERHRRLKSPSLRGRGLKLKSRGAISRMLAVALLAGAWIETPTRPRPTRSRWRRPPCGGVDRNTVQQPRARIERRSPSLRGRGSKPRRHGRHQRGRPVALLAGAWIETCATSSVTASMAVALLAGAWIETSPKSSSTSSSPRSPSLRGRGSKQHLDQLCRHGAQSPSLRGRGSKR